MATSADSGGESAQDRLAPTPAPAATATIAHDVYIAEDPNPPREIPPLTENQVAEVKSLLNADVSLKSVLDGEPYSVESMGPWVSDDREFIGALVEIAPDNPVSHDGILPVAKSYNKPADGSGELYVGGGQM